MLTNTDNFQVKKPVGSSWITDEDDVQKTKSALSDTGDYKAPDWGITGIPDKEMFDGLKSFQKREGLKVDAWPYCNCDNAHNNMRTVSVLPMPEEIRRGDDSWNLDFDQVSVA